jgi:hypothetical protein
VSTIFKIRHPKGKEKSIREKRKKYLRRKKKGAAT